MRNHQLESRVRENRTHGSEGGEGERSFLPLSDASLSVAGLGIDVGVPRGHDALDAWLDSAGRPLVLTGGVPVSSILLRRSGCHDHSGGR